VFWVNVQYIQCYILVMNTEHCIYWTSIQNTVYTGHQHRTLYVLDINRKHCIYWTLTLYTVYTGHKHKTLYTLDNVLYIQCSVLMSSIYSAICQCRLYTVFCVNVQCIQCFVFMSSIYSVQC
jgi:hypothetical protein